MKFYVNEKNWFRGQGSEESRLLRRNSDEMCCLGFVGLQCGATKKDIRSKISPFDAKTDKNGSLIKWPEWFSCFAYNKDREDVYNLMNINDSVRMTDHQRKKQIRAIFAKHGDQIVFQKGDSK